MPLVRLPFDISGILGERECCRGVGTIWLLRILSIPLNSDGAGTHDDDERSGRALRNWDGGEGQRRVAGGCPIFNSVEACAGGCLWRWRLSGALLTQLNQQDLLHANLALGTRSTYRILQPIDRPRSGHTGHRVSDTRRLDSGRFRLLRPEKSPQAHCG